jgi:hypothetical protein
MKNNEYFHPPLSHPLKKFLAGNRHPGKKPEMIDLFKWLRGPGK